MKATFWIVIVLYTSQVTFFPNLMNNFPCYVNFSPLNKMHFSLGPTGERGAIGRPGKRGLPGGPGPIGPAGYCQFCDALATQANRGANTKKGP